MIDRVWSRLYPYLLHTGHIYLPTFGVLVALGLMLALTFSLVTAARVGLSPDDVWEAGMFAVIAAFVLSRLLLIVTNWASFVRYPVLVIALPSLTPLGVVLTVVATWGWVWWKRMPMLALLDALAPCGTMVWGFAGLGEFFAGSDPGMETGLPWGMAMPGISVREHPVGVYGMVLAGLLTWALVHGLEKRRAQGDVFVGAMAGAGLVEFGLGFVRLPEVTLPGALGVLDGSQWVSVGMMVLAVMVWVQVRPAVVVKAAPFVERFDESLG